jgi:hypothetical protein
VSIVLSAGAFLPASTNAVIPPWVRLKNPVPGVKSESESPSIADVPATCAGRPPVSIGATRGASMSTNSQYIKGRSRGCAGGAQHQLHVRATGHVGRVKLPGRAGERGSAARDSRTGISTVLKP